MPTALTHRETLRGFSYMAFQILLLPVLLQAANQFADHFFSEAELNFLFFLINFLAVICIFHSFLHKSGKKLVQHPIYVLQTVILGLCGYFACSFLLNHLITRFSPGFINLNDQGIASMARSSRFLMAIGTVILVPPVEECFYRGLIFRNLLNKNTFLAYAVSMTAFAAIHLLAFLGSFSWMDLALMALQYLPAGLFLGWAYQKSETIYAPILIHALVNFWGIYQMR